jgi:xylulokinase
MMHTFTTGGMCLRWFRDTFAQAEVNIEKDKGYDSYHLLDKMAETIAPGSEGLITLPHLQGSMAPDMNSNAKGVFYGITLKHTRAHFIRSIMESLGYIICRNIEAIDQMGLRIDQIRSMGGGQNQIHGIKSKRTLWKRAIPYPIIQDVACIGAAILWTGAGFFRVLISLYVLLKHLKSYKLNLKITRYIRDSHKV